MTILLITLAWISASIGVAALFCGTFALNRAARRRAEDAIDEKRRSAITKVSPPFEEGRRAA